MIKEFKHHLIKFALAYWYRSLIIKVKKLRDLHNYGIK